MLNSYSQDSVLNIAAIQTIYGDIHDFAVDNMDNIYLVQAGNQIKKTNSKGDSLAVYNDIKRYGNIYSLDVTNPLKVLVYFRDFSTIVVLDRLLNVVNTIDLRRQNILQSSTIASSYDNNIWVYDDLNSKLKKIDDLGKVLLESTDFRQVFDPVPSPSAMYDRDGQLYMYDEMKGLIVFDYYGGRKNVFPITQYKDVQVIDKKTITGRDTNYIMVYKPSLLQIFSYKVLYNLKGFSKINFNGSRLYCLDKNNRLEIYQVVR